MNCSQCGAANATIHLTQIIDGARTTRDFCESCAPEDIRKRMQEIKGGTFNPEAEWKAKWEKLHAEHPEFSSEAFSFVQQGLSHNRNIMNDPAQEVSLSFSDVLESCQAYAKEIYGESAKAKLKSCGIETFGDVGEIMILLGSGGFKGELDPAFRDRLEDMRRKIRENLRQKYSESPFLAE